MKIWIDADACPGAIKDILVRAAERTKTETTFVANRSCGVTTSAWVRQRIVPAGFDVADSEIARAAEPGDLVVTSDIPLAAEILAKGASALSHRGERFTPDTIRGRLNLRDFFDTLRASGVQTGGPPALSPKDRKAFADQLDRFLARGQ